MAQGTNGQANPGELIGISVTATSDKLDAVLFITAFLFCRLRFAHYPP